MRFLLLAVITTVAVLGSAGVAGASAPFEFNLGFRTLAAQIPQVAGQPLEAEHYGANGDSLQRTSTGLMVWRKADNWTAFTDGTRTWINGPHGVQSRSNGERFPWESDSSAPSYVAASVAAESESTVEEAALGLINQSRQQYGLPPVAMDESLRQVARAHARDMATRGYFGHVSPDGRGLGDRLSAGGVSFGYAAENLGWSRGHASMLEGVRSNHESMMAEVPPGDGHRKNILSDRIRKAGIGVFRAADGKVYYVCDFTG